MNLLASATGIGGWAFNLVLLLHILTAIVGFGGVMLNGVYSAAWKKRSGDQAVAIFEANLQAVKIAEFFIYAVFPLGFLLVFLSEEVFKFSQHWLSGAMALYVVMLVISHGLMRPRVKKYGALLAESPSTERDQKMAALDKQIAMAAVVLNLGLLVELYLMIWKPWM